MRDFDRKATNARLKTGSGADPRRPFGGRAVNVDLTSANRSRRRHPGRFPRTGRRGRFARL